MKIIKAILSLPVAAAVLFAADFTFTEKTEITGGSLAGAMRVAAKFSKNVETTTTRTEHFSGNKMATVDRFNTQIIDLDAEKFTDVNHDKKQYSVITFAEFAQAMEKMMEKMGQATRDASRKEGAEVDMKYSFNVDRTGKKKAVAGADAEQVIMTMTMKATDKKSGQSGNFDIVVDSWMGEVPGHEVARAFYEKMGEKIGASALARRNMNPFLQQQGLGEGMAEAMAKMQEMKGVPLLQIMRMVGAGQTEGVVAAAKGEYAGQPFPRQESEGPSVKEAAGAAAVGSVLGGFGGFGRRKKKEEPPPQPQQQASAGPAAAQGVMMELVTQTVSFSTTPVDPAVMQVPAGYKQVEHEMKKLLKK